MGQGVLEAIGGLGMFLLGMFVMTDGLKELAGRSLRNVLRRFTRSPTSGAVTGAVATALVQSSSATTVTAVGFVGAGLLTFGQALGIIFGANVGTTITGWLVALFGFKLPLGTLAFPVVLVGALLRVLGRGRVAAVGQAIAGFGLVFVGIELLQAGLGGLEGSVTPSTFPPDTWWGRLQLVGIGAVVTVVTQSSSAGVALALASVSTGTITFTQAAAMVIGMDIGTTVTAAMAAAGGGTDVKRTGLAHVVYNVMTAVGAYFLLPVYVWASEAIVSDGLTSEPELFLVGFHTLFNGLAVVAVLPFANQFGALMERLVPEPLDDPAHGLGRALLRDPDAALDVLDRSLRRLGASSAAIVSRVWQQRAVHAIDRDEIAELQRALGRAEDYALEIPSRPSGDDVRRRHEAALHTIDHLKRLLGRLERTDRLRPSGRDDELERSGVLLVRLGDATAEWLGDSGPSPLDDAEELATQLGNAVRPYRSRMVREGIAGDFGPSDLETRLDVMRWLARMANHLWRISFYLEQISDTDAAGTGP